MANLITCKTCKFPQEKELYINIVKNCVTCRERTKEQQKRRKEEKKDLEDTQKDTIRQCLNVTDENEIFNTYVNKNGLYKLINQYTEFLKDKNALIYVKEDRIAVYSNLIIIKDFIDYLKEL